jgi:hypothetical protein
VSNLRSELGAAVERAGEGYKLAVDLNAIDSVCFEHAMEQFDEGSS